LCVDYNIESIDLLWYHKNVYVFGLGAEGLPAVKLFALTEAQKERLLACRAAWEEGEDEERLERLRQREEDAEILRAFASLLAEADFAHGGDLTYAQMARLLALARALAANPNLDARLLRRPGEPGALNRDLRDLLFGAGPLSLRLRHFLQRRHAGGQTAMQLLCATFPSEWPLITQAGLRALELTPEQQAAALKEARERFDLPEEPVGAEARGGVPDSDPVLRLLAEMVAYEAVRETLEAADFVEVHRLLTLGLAAKPPRVRRRAPIPLAYPRHTPDFDPATAVREETPPYMLPTPLPFVAPEPPPSLAGVSEEEVLAFLESYIAAQGFTYPQLAVRNYYISLQTKPFVLLSGLSGTGKTRLSSLFAEALTGAAEAQYRLLPVRPDWADSAPLLGYLNLLAEGGDGRGRFVSTPFLDFLQRAARPENAHRAYFLCLDEMNLARVEHYFAEVLSAMETPNRELLLPDGRAVRLPANLFLTGTLNTDEATYSLSRKVLDRANMLDFNEVYLRGGFAALREQRPSTEAPPPEIRQALFLYARVTTVAEARAKLQQIAGGKRDLAAEVVETLAEANDILQPYGWPFAYRIRDEALRYCANSFDRDGRALLVPGTPEDIRANLQTALDLQLLQKVLPRLTGTQEQMEPPLQEFLRWAEKRGLPQTQRKLTRMLARLQRDGFTGFEEV